jgi:hypothetical protein
VSCVNISSPPLASWARKLSGVPNERRREPLERILMKNGAVTTRAKLVKLLCRFWKSCGTYSFVFGQTKVHDVLYFIAILLTSENNARPGRSRTKISRDNATGPTTAHAPQSRLHVSLVKAVSTTGSIEASYNSQASMEAQYYKSPPVTSPRRGPSDASNPLRGVKICCTAIPPEKRVSGLALLQTLSLTNFWRSVC